MLKKLFLLIFLFFGLGLVISVSAQQLPINQSIADLGNFDLTIPIPDEDNIEEIKIIEFVNYDGFSAEAREAVLRSELPKILKPNSQLPFHGGIAPRIAGNHNYFRQSGHDEFGPLFKGKIKFWCLHHSNNLAIVLFNTINIARRKAPIEPKINVLKGKLKRSGNGGGEFEIFLDDFTPQPGWYLFWIVDTRNLARSYTDHIDTNPTKLR